MNLLPNLKGGRGWSWLWTCFALGAALALVTWQRGPSWSLVAIAGIATLGAALFLAKVRRPRGVAIAAVCALILCAVVAAGETGRLQELNSDWLSWSSAEREQRAQRVASSIGDVASSLERAAKSAAGDSTQLALLASGNGESAQLTAPSISGGVESALLLFRFGELVARSGQMRTPIAAGVKDGVRLVEGSFYTSLVARATSPGGDVQAVAVALIASAPPADRFARSLTQTLADRVDIARTVVESPDSAMVVPGSTVIVVPTGNQRLARVRALAYSEDETRLSLLQRARARTGVPLVVALVLVLATAWRRPAGTMERIGIAAILLVIVAVAPLSKFSNISRLFNATTYFAGVGGPFTANIAALLVCSTTVLAALIATLLPARFERALDPRHSRLRAACALAIVVIVAGSAPYFLGSLARGIRLSESGPSVALWISWQLALALVATSFLLVAVAAGERLLLKRRGIGSSVPVILAAVAVIAAPYLWLASGSWPVWYPALWMAAIALLAISRRGALLLVNCAFVAGAGAVTLTWGATVRQQMELARADLGKISDTDINALQLLRRFAGELSVDAQPITESTALLRRYAASELAQAGYPARLARWLPNRGDQPEMDISLAPVVDTIGAQLIVADVARETGQVEIRAMGDGPTILLIAGVPAHDSSVITIAVPPRTRLLPADPFATLTGVAGERTAEPPYRLTLAAHVAPVERAQPLVWRRSGDTMHGYGVVVGRVRASSSRDVHVEIDLRGYDVLIPRGALLILLDISVVLLLWGASATADGALGRWLRTRRVRWIRSYRGRLTVALLGFFVAPAAIFAGWAWYRLQADDAAARELLVREALRVAAGEAPRRELAAMAESAGAPLFLYRDGQLVGTSGQLLDALAPIGRLLPVALDARIGADDADVFATRRIDVGARRTLVGYRRLPLMESAVVLATPARGDEYALDARREDLGILVLFAAALGALAALWSSGVAARSLARPVGALREAALAIASGRTIPRLGTAPASEFSPVYQAFGRMASDLAASRAALEAAQRRTDAVLQHVASGVLAIMPDGEILIGNPRAESMLGIKVRGEDASLGALDGELSEVAHRCLDFLEGSLEEDAFDTVVHDRQLRARLTRLPNGAVLTLDDVTELASAQRILAWGEMARQIAHEIKNPLTPIRLGVQHLRRAYRDGRSDFGTILDTNVSRVLAEIDHLDEIARSFSRYGTAPADQATAQPIDVIPVVRDVVALERIGESGVAWSFESEQNETIIALANGDELREVLLNILENARLAGSTVVTVSVTVETETVSLRITDNGSGIPAEILPQVFQPHFSTRTSGSGLGLAISRRLIEGWGGTIKLNNSPQGGAIVEIRLRHVG